MKIKFLALAALFCAMSSNVLAAITDYALDKDNGVRYMFDPTKSETVDGTTLAKAFSAYVYGPTTAVTSMKIPASFTTTDENGIVKYFKVAGFLADWGNAAVTTPAQAVRAKVTTTLTTLEIEATYMTAGLANAFTNLEALASIKISGAPDAWTNTGWVTGPLVTGNAKIKETLTTVDLSGMAKCTEVSAANTFKDLPKVTTVTLPKSIETIADFAFSATAITSLDLSETKVTVLPAAAFYKSKLETISLPEGLTTIKTAAFQEAALKSITIPAKVTSIEHDAFYKCEALTTADLSAAVDITIINSKTFFGAKALTAITIPAKVTSIGESAFEGCEALATITMSATELATIGDAAFKGTAITAFEVPATVTSIGESAFEGCKSLATFTFATRADDGAALATIGASAFKNCEALTAIDLSSKKFTFTSIPATWFVGCTALKEIKVSENLMGIAPNAFKDCVIEELDLSGVSEYFVNLYAIFGVEGTHDATKNPNSLKSIILPETLKKIDPHVFDYSAIEEITLPASLTSAIPAYAFYYCEDLKSVTYLPTHPTTVQVFDTKAFIGCTPFVKINTNSNYFAISTVEPTNATFGLAEDLQVTTVADKGASKKFFGKICAPLHMQISKEDLGDAKLYSVYVDEGVAYFQALKVKKGYYKIKEGENIIVKTNEAATINFELQKAPWETSITEDAVFNFKETVNTADFQAGTVPAAKFTKGTVVPFVNGSNYVYALTNSAKSHGFGFTFYKGTTMPAGAFFIVSTLNPNAAGRLESVWLDEDGNVESEATAINKIQSETEDGAIYNLQGVRVNAAKKGIYIKNGKKYIMK